ncbi:type II and III secretion system protein family protein [Stutzerimonas zhaodongensis]|uniref:type II and III secretion system protein family protein n=1 Tax=Stutzerimonas zhaodongensis TaxID=1176257 RepID=UPI0039EF554F
MRRWWVAFSLLPALAIAQVQDAEIELGSGEGRVIRFTQPVDSVLVAEPTIADLQVVSPGVIYVFGKRPGNTTLVALDKDSNQIAGMSLNVGANSQPVSRALNSEGRVQVTGAGNRLTAKGQVRDVSEAINLNALLDPQGQDWESSVNTAQFAGGSAQVNIRVRFAEVSRDELLRYGVSWNALFNNGTFSFGLLTGGSLPAQSAAGASNLIGLGLDSGHFNIDSVLEALQSNGVLEILAEPNITASTGETASFLAGGEVPVPVPVNSDLVGVQYKSYGVSLVFSPTLLPNDRIALQVRPEVSTLMGNASLSVSGYQVPSFRVRRADTRVEVGSGQTFAIAGLFQRNSSQDLEKLPLLGDMPVLGNLFRSKRFQRNETELVILITPYLVEPVQTAKATLSPTDTPPQPTTAALISDGGPFGFYME